MSLFKTPISHERIPGSLSVGARQHSYLYEASLTIATYPRASIRSVSYPVVVSPSLWSTFASMYSQEAFLSAAIQVHQ